MMGAAFRIVGSVTDIVPEDDRLLWIERQANLLCRKNIPENLLPGLTGILIDCIERERSQAQLLLRRIVELLGTWLAVPAARTPILRDAIGDMREQLAAMFEDSPSLKSELAKHFGAVLDAYDQDLLARRGFEHFPIASDPTFEDCIDPTYLPGEITNWLLPDLPSVLAGGRAELSRSQERSGVRSETSGEQHASVLLGIRRNLLQLMERLIHWYKQSASRTPQNRSAILRLRFQLNDEIEAYPSWLIVAREECDRAFERAWRLYATEHLGGARIAAGVTLPLELILVDEYFPEEQPIGARVLTH